MFLELFSTRNECRKETKSTFLCFFKTKAGAFCATCTVSGYPCLDYGNVINFMTEVFFSTSEAAYFAFSVISRASYLYLIYHFIPSVNRLTFKLFYQSPSRLSVRFTFFKQQTDWNYKQRYPDMVLATE